MKQITAAKFYETHTSPTNYTMKEDQVTSVKVEVHDLQTKLDTIELEKSASGKVNKVMGNTKKVQVFACNDGNFSDWGFYQIEKTYKNYFLLALNKKRESSSTVVTRSQKRFKNETSANLAFVTEYNGVRFRSRLEARTAVFLDAVNLKWKYEVFTCRFPRDCEKSSYTPDFFLPDLQMFVEIKPAFPHLDELFACENFVKTTGMPIVLLYGDTLGAPYRCSKKDGGRFYTHSTVQRGITWDANGDRIGGEVVWIRDEDGDVTLGNISNSKDERWDDDEIIEKLQHAATYNFFDEV